MSSNTSLLTNVTLDDFATAFNWGNSTNLIQEWNVPNSTSVRGFPNNDTYLTQFVDGTYHETTTFNASTVLTFTGSSIYIYGISSTTQGFYTASLLNSPVKTTSPVVRTAHSNDPTMNETNYLLFAATGLDPTRLNQVELINLGDMGNSSYGDALLIDYALATVVVGAQDATITNTTIQNTNTSILSFVGEWNSNNDTRFPGDGSSSFTNQPGATVSFNFTGSAVYIYGDTVDDHGLYTVQLDSSSPQTFNDYTENLKFDTLKYYSANLNSSQHTLTITNSPLSTTNTTNTTSTTMNSSTFFDFDSIIISLPSQFSNDSSSENVSGAAAGGSGQMPNKTISTPAITTTGAPVSTAKPTTSTSGASRGRMMRRGKKGVALGVGFLASLLLFGTVV